MEYYLLTNGEYKNHVTAFKAWLKVQGYSGSTIKGYPKAAQEFFFHLQKVGIPHIENINQEVINSYCEWIKIRPNQKQEGALSNSQINRHYGAINKFKEYIAQTQNLQLPFSIKLIPKEKTTEVDFLTPQEIKALYQVTDETPIGYRDRAMLSVYYGCGLRRNEGAQLDISHILTDRKIVLVTHPKNNYERHVPITGKHLLNLIQYMETARPFFLPLNSGEQAFFISERGQRLGAQMMYVRLQRLAELAGITKAIGVHTLRHSIATHLLQKGMELENIALFLGHRCLDSTQVYTHIVNEKYKPL